MKIYPTLYSRDSLGNVRVWWAEQEKDSYRMVSGLQNGEKVRSEWTFALGKNVGKKNETTQEDQATKEVESKYRDQKSTGYFENITDIDKQLYFAPMLAHKWENCKDDIDWSNGNYISPKMDGLRAILTKNGATSRNGKPLISFPHISEELKPLFDINPNFIFDGEIFCRSQNFEKIISLAKKSKPTLEDLEESRQHIEYWIFDFPSVGGGFHSRYTQLVSLIENYLPNNRSIKICPHKLIKSPSEIEENLQSYIKDNFEGLMLNIYNGEYQSKRSKNILKYKLFEDLEAEIIDIIEGVGNRSGMFGYAKLKLDDGKEFDSNARGNEEMYKRVLLEKRRYIGKKAVVRYQNLTAAGIPRFPVIIDFDRFD